ncbi:MAG: hypothetical protein E6Q67_01750 [Roseateles sp.]|nr:MAG: hypothetical protein E6Q67_01750 [Roseateles sp.]
MFDWIVTNKEWFLSGLGITLATAVLRYGGQALSTFYETFPVFDRRWRGADLLSGHWAGQTKEEHYVGSHPMSYSVVWDFVVRGRKISATSTSTFEKDGKVESVTYALKGEFVTDQFFTLEYRNSDDEILNFGTEVLQLDYDGKSFSGWFTGFNSRRGGIIAGKISGARCTGR